jgi:hypothetical protein
MDVGQAASGALKSLGTHALAVIQSSNVDGIPESPMANMGNAFLRGDVSSVKLLQKAIDSLTVKAKLGKAFTDDDKEFMTELFESMWWGGSYKGYYEAAILASHYVNGNGALLFINPDCYIASTIVRDTMTAMMGYLKSINAAGNDFLELRSTDAGFFNSSFARPLRARARKLDTQGQLLPGGVLLAEQNNLRLKNADHRFVLQVTVRKNAWSSRLSGAAASARNTWHTNLQGVTQWATGIGASDQSIDSFKALDADHDLRWKVDSLYDFEPFPTAYYTPLPIAAGLQLKLPDGLSQHLTKVGVAADFKYYTEW